MSEQFNRKVITLKLTLDNEVRCLPLANIEIEIGNIDLIRTKATVVDENLERNICVFGYQTHKLIHETGTTLLNYKKSSDSGGISSPFEDVFCAV